MNEQLQAKLVEILSSIQSAAKATGDFAIQQLPDIAQSYVLYGRVNATLSVLLIFLAFAAILFGTLRYGYFNKGGVDIHGYWKESRVMACGFGTLGSLLFFCMFSIQIPEALLVWFAPKVWLLKEIAGMLK